MPRPAPALAVVALLMLGLACTPRYVAYETVDIGTPFPPNQDMLLGLVDYCEAMSYQVLKEDLPHGSFRVRSPNLRGTSYFRVAIAEDGYLILLPEGGYVRDQGATVHRKFLAGARAFAAELEGAIGQMYESK